MSLDPKIEDKFVTANGYKLRYIEKGSGRPLIALHGLSATVSADQWLPVIDALAGAARVIALDMPGWGLSDLPADGYSFDMFTQTIDAFCDALGLSEVDVMGQSMGGWWAGLFAHAHPEKVRRAILVGAAGLNAGSASLSGTFQAMNRDQIRGGMLREWGAGRAVTDADLDELERRMNLPGRVEAYNAARGLIFTNSEREKYSLRTRLPDLQMPVLMVWGDDGGGVVNLQHGIEAFQLAPNGRLILLYGGGHNAAGFKTAAFAPQAIEFLGAAEVKPVEKLSM